jgi:hypothetical protein
MTKLKEIVSSSILYIFARIRKLTRKSVYNWYTIFFLQILGGDNTKSSSQERKEVIKEERRTVALGIFFFSRILIFMNITPCCGSVSYAITSLDFSPCF